MKKFLISLLVLVSALILICGCKTAILSTDELYDEYYTVNFIIDGEVFSNTDTKAGATLINPDTPYKDGFVFDGWYTTEDYTDKWDFNLSTVENTLNLYGLWVKQSEASFVIKFYDNSVLVKSAEVPFGALIPEYTPEPIDGYLFVGWFDNNTLYDFSKPAEKEIILISKWEAQLFTASFVAEGFTISEENYSVEDKNIVIPEVPTKPHYSGEWEQFELETGNVIIKAIYTPVQYTANFMVDDNLYKQLIYSIEEELIIPNIPEKQGYSSEWTGLTEILGDITVTAEYEIIIYNINFVIDGQIIEAVTYTVNDKNIILPEIPHRSGYCGNWEDFELNLENLDVTAEYKIIDYFVTFIVDGEQLDCIKFNVEDMTVSPPDIPQKDGYIGLWENYDVQLNDFSVSANYLPVTYTASFYVDGELIAETHFTIEDENIETPAIPEKEGYLYRWEEIEITASDIDINAICALIKYTVTFIADETEIETISFTIENMEISEPPIPEKNGYTAVWEDYSLSCRNLIVNAIYTEIIQPDIEPDIPVEPPTEPDIKDEPFVKPEKPEQPDINPVKPETPPVEPDIPENPSVPEIPEEPDVNPELPDEPDSPSIDTDEPEVKDEPDEPEIEFPDEFIYSTNSDGTLTITGYDGNETFLIIPSEHNGLKVKAIGEFAFFNLSITSVKISNGIETIGDYAFMNCKLLSDVILPESIKSIGNYAFVYCNFTEIYLSDNITSIGEQAFAHSALINVKLPANLNKLENIFYDCTELCNVYLCNIEIIGSNTFYNCISLTEIVIPNSVKIIEPSAFENCINLQSVKFENTDSWNTYNASDKLVYSLTNEEINDENQIALYLTSVFKALYWKYEG